MKRCWPVAIHLGVLVIAFACIVNETGECCLLEEWDDGPVGDTIVDARGYDVDHLRQLRQTFASRLALRHQSF